MTDQITKYLALLVDGKLIVKSMNSGEVKLEFALQDICVF